MIHEIKSYLPVFQGFYGTIFEANEEPMIEDGYTSDDYEWDYNAYHQAVAKRCTSTISDWLNKELGLTMMVKYEDLYSPREYNFCNDSINVTYLISDYGISKVKAFLNANAEAFQEYLNENHKSRSGFVSFISHHAIDWLNTDWSEKGVYLGSILEFIFSTFSDEYDAIALYYSCEDIYIDGELKETAE